MLHLKIAMLIFRLGHLPFIHYLCTRFFNEKERSRAEVVNFLRLDEALDLDLVSFAHVHGRSTC